jgi:hypothetical protein
LESVGDRAGSGQDDTIRFYGFEEILISALMLA